MNNRNFKQNNNYKVSVKNTTDKKRRKVDLKEVEEIIKNWKEKNSVGENGRYSKLQLIDLDKDLCGVLATSEGKNQGIYYKIHLFNYVLLLLGEDSYSVEYEISNLKQERVDIPVEYRYIKHKEGDTPENIKISQTGVINSPLNVKGKSIIVSYRGMKYLPKQHIYDARPIYRKGNGFYCADDSEIDTDLIGNQNPRAFVKTIALNTGLGYLCFADPDYVIEQMAEKDNPAVAKAVNDQITNWGVPATHYTNNEVFNQKLNIEENGNNINQNTYQTTSVSNTGTNANISKRTVGVVPTPNTNNVGVVPTPNANTFVPQPQQTIPTPAPTFNQNVQATIPTPQPAPAPTPQPAPAPAKPSVVELKEKTIQPIPAPVPAKKQAATLPMNMVKPANVKEPQTVNNPITQTIPAVGVEDINNVKAKQQEYKTILCNNDDLLKFYNDWINANQIKQNPGDLDASIFERFIQEKNIDLSKYRNN